MSELWRNASFRSTLYTTYVTFHLRSWYVNCSVNVTLRYIHKPVATPENVSCYLISWYLDSCLEINVLLAVSEYTPPFEDWTSYEATQFLKKSVNSDLRKLIQGINWYIDGTDLTDTR